MPDVPGPSKPRDIEILHEIMAYKAWKDWPSDDPRRPTKDDILWASASADLRKIRGEHKPRQPRPVAPPAELPPKPGTQGSLF